LKRIPGGVSKESLKFFVPLYKKCRKLGFERNDIYFGIKGSREFFVRDSTKENQGKFVDFCIPSINIVIEYNGTFWHPRKENEWEHPFLDYEAAKLSDEYRKQLCENRNLDLFLVWSDDNLIEKTNELFHEITKRFENAFN
jgi:hypothetical protein